MSGNEDDAHDILQDGFIIALGKINQLREPKMFGGWLKRIVINQCIAHSKQKVVYSELQPPEMEIIHGADESWWTNISMVQIHEAIKQLPEGCRQVFVLHAVEDYTHNEIAHELQINIGTSKSQYSRAKQLLQQIILKKMVANG
jgi:RNA polymerase sigma factor (sigma-70 family)